MSFLVVGVVLRFVVLRGVIAVINMLPRGLVVLADRESWARKYHQKEHHQQEFAHARILTRTRSPSAISK